MKRTFLKWFPPFLMLVMALWFFSRMQTPPDPGFAFSGFGKLPVVFNGRLKPMDSLARNSLLQIRQTQTLDPEPWKNGLKNKKPFPPSNGWLA